MRRGVNLLVSGGANGRSSIVEGAYQSPILVQWRPAPTRTRFVDVTLTRFK
jgi:hypothetical protein